jgi:prophage regulatory protein
MKNSKQTLRGPVQPDDAKSASPQLVGGQPHIQPHLNQAELHCAILKPAGFLRLVDIIGRAATKTSPAIPAIIPVSKSTWWAGVRTGRYPKPTRQLGARITAWSIESIRTFIAEASMGDAS